MALGDEVKIPSSAIVRCPMRNHGFIRAQSCEPCKHFAGLTHAFNNPALPFERQFMIGCIYRTDRELVQFDEAKG